MLDTWSLRILCILSSSSHIQTYFSKIICLLWDLSLQLLHGPIWTALSGCQSGIIFVNVVSVFLNLDIHTHTQRKKGESGVADQKTVIIHTLPGEKSYKNVMTKPNSIHIHASCVNSTVTASHPSQHWIQFCQTVSVTVCFQQLCGLQFHIICSPLACYLCFLSNIRQSLYQDLHNLLANTESQGEKEVVTNYLRIHVIQGLVFKKQYIQSRDYTEVILYESTMYGILKWNNIVYSFISHRKGFLYIQPNLDFSAS